MKKIVLRMLRVVFAFLLVLGNSAFAQDAVRFGVPNPMTGAAAGFGRDAKMGADMAAAEINSTGGVLGGKKVRLIYEDDKGTPQGGVAAVQKLISEFQVHAIVGGSNSSVVLAESSVTKNRILQINSGAQADAITNQGNPWLFQINNTASANSAAFNGYVTGKIAPKSVAYLGENSEFGKEMLSMFRQATESAGVKLVNVSTYDSSTNDFTSIISKIKATKPDMLYVVDAYPARSAQLWKQIRQQGGFPIEAQAPGVVQESMLVPAEGAMNGVITGDIFVAEGKTPEMTKFIRDFRERYKVEPNKVHLVNYEAIKVLAQALNKAGTTTDYNKLASTLRANTWATPRGQLRFDEKGRARALYFYIHEVKNGKIVLRDTILSQ